MANSSSRAFALIFRNCIQLHGDKPIEKKIKKKDIDGRVLQNSIKIPPDCWFTPVTRAARDFLKPKWYHYSVCLRFIIAADRDKD